MTFVKYFRPCKTKTTRDDFKAHVARGSRMPGLDYACNTGDAIFATADGKIEVADKAANDTTGISITMKHPDGQKSHYLHLSKLLVKQGERVKRGDKIALSGNTGTTSTGAHLHFALQNKKGAYIDPKKFFTKNARDAKAIAAEAAATPVAEVVLASEIPAQ